MSGNAGYRPAPGYEDRRHFIGPVKSPVWIGRKGDVPGLINVTFWRYFEAWRMFNIGAGFPEPGTWADQDGTLIEVILSFEENYRAFFSGENKTLELLTNIAKLLAGRRR